MRVFAPAAFRDAGVDYPYGWQDLPQSIGESLLAKKLVSATEAGNAMKSLPGSGSLDDPSRGTVLSSVGSVAQEHIVIGGVGDSRIKSMFTDDPVNIVRCAANWQMRALALMGQPALIGYVGGVAGERTDQFALRISIAASDSTLTDVFLKGGINDVAQLYPSATTSGATAAANMIAYAKQLLAAGKRVWLEEDEGSDQNWVPATAWTSAMSQQLGIMNSLLEKWARGVKNAVFIKWGPVMYDRSSATNKFLVGAKYDATHDSTGGSLVKAQQFVSKYGQIFPVAQPCLPPSLSVYSGDPANPNQLLDNPGFTARTGGTLNSTQATLTAWAATTVVAAKSIRTNGGNVYYTVAGGTTGSTAPVHTSGSASDGGVTWIYLMSATNSIPQYWTASSAGGGSYAIGTNINSENGVEIVLLAIFSAAGSTVSLISGSDTNAAFRGRQVPDGLYELQATIQVDDHTNMGTTWLQWNRGDLSNPPADGYAASALWTDNQTSPNFTGQLGTYPVKETRRTKPYPAAAQTTSNGNTLGTVATWNNIRIRVDGAGAGFAIVRIRDSKMVRVG